MRSISVISIKDEIPDQCSCKPINAFARKKIMNRQIFIQVLMSTWLCILILPGSLQSQTALMSDDFDVGRIETGPGKPWSDESDLYPGDPVGLRVTDDSTSYGSIVGVDDYGAVGDAEWLWPCTTWDFFEHFLITNPVDCTGMTNITVNYDLSYYIPWAIDYFSLHYRLSASGTWILLYEYTAKFSQDYVDEVKAIPAAANEPFLQVAFKYIAATNCTTSSTWYVLDEVSINGTYTGTPPPTNTPTSTHTPGPTPTVTPEPDIPIIHACGQILMLLLFPLLHFFWIQRK